MNFRWFSKSINKLFSSWCPKNVTHSSPANNACPPSLFGGRTAPKHMFRGAIVQYSYCVVYRVPYLTFSLIMIYKNKWNKIKLTRLKQRNVITATIASVRDVYMSHSVVALKVYHPVRLHVSSGALPARPIAYVWVSAPIYSPICRVCIWWWLSWFTVG